MQRRCRLAKPKPRSFALLSRSPLLPRAEPLHIVAVCYSGLQCVAVCCSAPSIEAMWEAHQLVKNSLVTQPLHLRGISRFVFKRFWVSFGKDAGLLWQSCWDSFECRWDSVDSDYGVATISGLLQIICLLQNIISFIGLFCKRDLSF